MFPSGRAWHATRSLSTKSCRCETLEPIRAPRTRPIPIGRESGQAGSAQLRTFANALALPTTGRQDAAMTRIKRLLRSCVLVSSAMAAPISAPAQAASQIPLAAGSYKQLSLVMVAADKCGFRSFRIQESAWSYKYLYTADDLGSYPCVQDWLKSSARRLGLKPRYPEDDYQR